MPPLIRPATPADNETLIDLVLHAPQGDRLVVGSDRRPDFFRRAQPYAPARVFLLEEGGRPAATVSGGLKDVLLAGRRQRAAYVFDLAVAPAARGRGYAAALLAEVAAWAGENAADFLFAHVVSGNRGGMATFASAGYRDVLRLDSRLFATGGRPAPGGEMRPLEDDDWGPAAALLQDSLGGYDLVRPLDGAGLRALWESLPGYDPGDVWVCGRPPRAVLGLWDYSTVTRTVLERATLDLRLAMTALSGLRAARLPVPPTPRLRQPFGYGLLLGGGGDPGLLRRMFLAARARAAGRGLGGIVFFHDPRARPAWVRGLGVATRYHLVARGCGSDAEHLGDRFIWVDPADL